MFKNDKRSLSRLAFLLDERDAANFKHVLEKARKEELLDVSDRKIEQALKSLDGVGKIKLNQKYYAFHVEDDYAEEQGGESEGVEIHLRRGDALTPVVEVYSRMNVPQVESCIKYLKSVKARKIYTGPIPDGGFLGLAHDRDPDEHSYTADALNDNEVREFTEGGIEVVILDSLI